MQSPNRHRKRAVQLTPEGIALIKSSLDDHWRTRMAKSKLTREVKAEMLGVSVATAERILAGNGVDRSTLTYVFRNLGIPWLDSYCVSYENASPEAIEECPCPSPTAPPVERSRRVGYLAGVLLVSVGITGGVIFEVAKNALDFKSKVYWGDTLRGFQDRGSNAFHAGYYDRAQEEIDQAIQLARRHNSASELANGLRLAGDIAAARGRFRIALQHYERALEIRRAFHEDVSVPTILEAIGAIQVKTGQYADAKSHLTESLNLYRTYSDPVGVSMSCRNLGTLALAKGEITSAAKWFQVGLATIRDLGKTDLEMDILARLAQVWSEQHRFEPARKQLRSCLAHWERRGHVRWIATTHLQLGNVELEAGQLGSARAEFRRSRDGFMRAQDEAGSAEAASRLELCYQKRVSRVGTVNAKSERIISSK